MCNSCKFEPLAFAVGDYSGKIQVRSFAVTPNATMASIMLYTAKTSC